MGKVVLILLAVLSAVIRFFVLLSGIGDSDVLRPNLWTVPMIFVLRLGNVWTKREK